MKNGLKGFYFQIFLLVSISLIVFQLSSSLVVAKRLLLPMSINPKLVTKVSFDGTGDGMNSNVKCIYSKDKRILLATDDILSCRSTNGSLIWQRELEGTDITIEAMGENVLLIDKVRGDLSLINMKNEIIIQKKDIGEINQFAIYKGQYAAFSSYKDKTIHVFDSMLKKVGTITPPVGDIVRFKYSRVEPRLLIYITNLNEGKLSSFIYHYDKLLSLIASNDLGNSMVYDFEFLSDLIIVGYNWIGTVAKEVSNNTSVDVIKYDLEEIQGVIEQTGSNQTLFAAQYLVTEGDEQGTSKLIVIDRNNKSETIPLANLASDEILLGERFIITRDIQNLTIYDYDFRNLSSLTFDNEVLSIQWIDSYRFLVHASDGLYIYMIR